MLRHSDALTLNYLASQRLGWRLASAASRTAGEAEEKLKYEGAAELVVSSPEGLSCFY